jgi:hypothetical protein
VIPKVSRPLIGDQSTAWRATSLHTSASGPPDRPLISDLEFDFVVVRRGNLLAVLVESGDAPRADDPSFFEKEATTQLVTFAQQVDGKLQAIEGKVPIR